MLRLFLILNNIHYHHISLPHTTNSNHHSLGPIINHITVNQVDDSQLMAFIVASLVILLRFDPNKKKQINVNACQ